MASRSASPSTWSRPTTWSTPSSTRARRKLLVASREAKGFVVAEDECLATTRKGKQVLVVDAPDEARLVKPVEGDDVATIGDNRRLLVFPLNQVPEMPRGKGVRLQRFRDGGLADETLRARRRPVVDRSAERNFTVDKRELREWIGTRSDSGRLPPEGLPEVEQVRVSMAGRRPDAGSAA